ncbi:MAG: NAD(P)-dependent oxidoreductase [Acidobacteria bacterium]|nr:NAD(P)-dependent oxidoreductase [Acidobacteriota bacterium]
MSQAQVVFLHGLNQKTVDLITSCAPEGFTITEVEGNLCEEDQIKTVQNADFLMVYRAAVSDGLLRAASKLRLVQLLAAGYDSMQLTLLRELGIPCANNGGANSWTVADHTVLLMLSLYKRLILADRATREGRWREPIDGFNTFEMANKQIGILGIGNIGRKVAQRVQAFDAQVQYYDKYPLEPARERELKVKRVALQELFHTSDIVSCHTALTPETHHLINRESLALMKPTALLINTSRGAVVEEGALIEALQEGRIAGAGLDVFEKEPVERDNPLLRMENVVVTPHSAGTTWNTWCRRAEFAYRNMQRVLEGHPPLAMVQDNEA